MCARVHTHICNWHNVDFILEMEFQKQIWVNTFAKINSLECIHQVLTRQGLQLWKWILSWYLQTFNVLSEVVLSWPNSLFRFSCKMLWKNLNKLFGEPYIINECSRCIQICFWVPELSVLKLMSSHPSVSMGGLVPRLLQISKSKDPEVSNIKWCNICI